MLPIEVIIDTNFITIPAQFGVDIFSEAQRILEKRLEFVLLMSVVEEINTKFTEAESKTEKRKFKIAKDLTGRCKIIDVAKGMEQTTVDDQLLDYAASVNGVLATNDKALRRKAHERRIPVLVLRGKKHLMLEGTVV
ncbi:MAG: type II toxin-antitoxin system VapC family toxin [Candidatus Thorarchaeota archaeon]|jgi:rRNA-processing protein FCF1